MSTAITHSVEVSVHTQYEPSFVGEGGNERFFSYQITIKNLGNTPVKLLSRHWFILDSDGEKREVKGEGVLGQQPIIHPGDKYQYTSGCPLYTDIGVMWGYYSMVRSVDEQLIKVNIPRFKMILPARLN